MGDWTGRGGVGHGQGCWLEWCSATTEACCHGPPHTAGTGELSLVSAWQWQPRHRPSLTHHYYGPGCSRGKASLQHSAHPALNNLLTCWGRGRGAVRGWGHRQGESPLPPPLGLPFWVVRPPLLPGAAPPSCTHCSTEHKHGGDEPELTIFISPLSFYTTKRNDLHRELPYFFLIKMRWDYNFPLNYSFPKSDKSEIKVRLSIDDFFWKHEIML